MGKNEKTTVTEKEEEKPTIDKNKKVESAVEVAVDKVKEDKTITDEEVSLKREVSDEKKENGDIKEQNPIIEECMVQKTAAIETQSLQKEESTFMPGVLEITVQRASELVNNDKIGKSDPYVKVRYVDEEFRSKTINNTLEPEWNFSCEFDILNLEEKYIHINVYDDDFGKDNIEGCYSLFVKEAIFELVEKGKWYNLVGCKTGKVYISTKYTPVKMEDTSTEKPVRKDICKDISEDIEADNFEKAEKIVGDIVQKAEKVIGEVQAKLNETESNVSKTLLSSENDVNVTKEQIKKISVDKDDEFIEISKESEVIIQKMEKTFVE